MSRELPTLKEPVFHDFAWVVHGTAQYSQGTCLVNGIWRVRYISLQNHCIQLWRGSKDAPGFAIYLAQVSASLWPYFSLCSTPALRCLKPEKLETALRPETWIFHEILTRERKGRFRQFQLRLQLYYEEGWHRATHSFFMTSSHLLEMVGRCRCRNNRSLQWVL